MINRGVFWGAFTILIFSIFLNPSNSNSQQYYAGINTQQGYSAVPASMANQPAYYPASNIPPTTTYAPPAAADYYPAASTTAVAPQVYSQEYIANYIRQVSTLIMRYPIRMQDILNQYLGIKTQNIDIREFERVVARGYPEEVYNETYMLYNNKQAINSGTYTDNRYIKPVIKEEKSMILGMSKPVAYVVGAAVVGGGAAAAFAGGGGGGSSGTTLAQGDPLVNDAFGRTFIHFSLNPDFFVDSEFHAYPLNALEKENADYAYARGLTGNNVPLGVYDWFNSTSADSSHDYYYNLVYAYLPADPADNDCTLDHSSFCNHGETVATRLAANRNQNAYFGMAYKADLMLESVYNGSFTHLVDAGAKIINTSCGNCADLTDLQYARAHDVLVTAATGNLGGPEPENPAGYASQLDYYEIAVGALDSGGTVTYADRCGSQMNYCMYAYSADGTSFASPQIAGAAAIIREGWSFLTAKQTAQILLLSATDLGAHGVDEIYGRGLLNIKAALEPVGITALALGNGSISSFTTSSISQNTSSSALGDAFANSANAKGNIVIVDSFGRDFAVKTQDNLISFTKSDFTPENLEKLGSKKEYKEVSYGEGISFKFNSEKGDDGKNQLSSFGEYNIDKTKKVELGFSTDVNETADTKSIRKFNKNGFIDSSAFNNGFLNFSDNNQVFSTSFEMEINKNFSTKFTNLYSKNNYISDLVSAENQVTSQFTSSIFEAFYSPSKNLKLDFKNGFTHEFDSLLGSKFAGAFDLADGSDTFFSGIDASYDINDKWNLFASYSVGATATKPSANSSFSDVSKIFSDIIAVTVSRDDIIGDDSLSFSISQPLRVFSGSASGLTQSVDPTSGTVSITGFRQDLVPSGRTMMFQTAYEKEISKKLDINLATEYVKQPDHSIVTEDQKAVMSKLKYKFN